MQGELATAEQREWAVKRVLIDCDGVIADFCGGFLKLVNARFGTSLASTDIGSYDIAKAVGWSTKQANEAYQLIADCPDFAAKLDVFPGAIDGVRRLREVAEIYAVTSPWHTQPTWCHDRSNWLWRHFGIPAHHVIHACAKHLVRGDMLVDDKLSHVEEWRAAWPDGVAVLWETPHNRRDLWDGPSTSSWDFLVDLVARLS